MQKKEQIIRPTGLLDPEIEVRPSENQIDDLLDEILTRTNRHERVLITTLTKLPSAMSTAALKMMCGLRSMMACGMRSTCATPWPRIWQCLRNDTEEAEYRKRLGKILTDKTRHK